MAQTGQSRHNPMLSFIDSGVLIAAARGTTTVAEAALAILDDPERTFASSDFVRLEVLPKPTYYGFTDEVAFYGEFFDAVTAWAVNFDAMAGNALEEGKRVGLAAMDALHVAGASEVGASELVTTEKSTKPIHRNTLVPVRSLNP